MFMGRPLSQGRLRISISNINTKLVIDRVAITGNQMICYATKER